jgi:hypothetical protein
LYAFVEVPDIPGRQEDVGEQGLISDTSGGLSRFYGFDPLGNLGALWDASGQSLWQGEYDAWLVDTEEIPVELEPLLADSTYISAIDNSMPSKIIALGYFDGPVSGVVLYTNTIAFHFNLLGCKHIDDIDVRLFSFSPLPVDAFKRIVQVCSTLSTPSWPVWVPVWKFPSERERDRADKQVNIALETARDPVAIAIWSGLAEKPESVKSIVGLHVEPNTDWFSLISSSFR